MNYEIAVYLAAVLTDDSATRAIKRAIGTMGFERLSAVTAYCLEHNGTDADLDYARELRKAIPTVVT